jgi:hypothetical protein
MWLQEQRSSSLGIAMGNFPMVNVSPDPPPFGENFPIPIHGGGFSHRSEPNEEWGPDDDPRPRHNHNKDVGY